MRIALSSTVTCSLQFEHKLMAGSKSFILLMQSWWTSQEKHHMVLHHPGTKGSLPSSQDISSDFYCPNYCHPGSIHKQVYVSDMWESWIQHIEPHTGDLHDFLLQESSQDFLEVNSLWSELDHECLPSLPPDGNLTLEKGTSSSSADTHAL